MKSKNENFNKYEGEILQKLILNQKRSRERLAYIEMLSWMQISPCSLEETRYFLGSIAVVLMLEMCIRSYHKEHRFNDEELIKWWQKRDKCSLAHSLALSQKCLVGSFMKEQA